MEDYDPFDVFDIKVSETPAEELASEHLAVHRIYYEITLNIPQESMTLLEHIEVYKNVWAHLKTFYNVVNDMYFIEYCKSGQAHLHGYLCIEYPLNALAIDDIYFLDDISKQVFLKMPRKYWKQYKKAQTYPAWRMLKTPLLCINMKNILSTNWINYIQKNAPKN